MPLSVFHVLHLGRSALGRRAPPYATGPLPGTHILIRSLDLSRTTRGRAVGQLGSWLWDQDPATPPAPVKSSPTGPIPGSYRLNRMLDGGLVAARNLDAAEGKYRINLIP